ncbi:MATE family multidrug resistance protein [Pullulanibacillus pueri]|uniref:Probable multidrug resistance protein NorM n=1 Tax=Pullulanibacillus pueri TaxID=1437324 RepID=A0A8J3ELQ2_9BACL|nr:MATE family efflux transporter [Pullulanibacillus pueri]MBM7681170.1 MATE family multidrug resistance protein [Pullulanibacillus pueri]GGH77321.1 putative multidrug resistance protein NorM [Pullulanibacillus pueri]
MYATQTTAQKVKVLLSLLLPILVTQIGMSAMNFFDTLMSGHAGTHDLAGVAIGSSLWVPVFTGLSGILISLTTLISHHIGNKRQKAVPFTLIQALYLSIIIALLVMIIGSFVLQPILNLMDLTSDVQRIAAGYLRALAVGMIPLFIYGVLRNFIDAHGKTNLSMLITLSSLPINILFNYLFIFGKLGFPRLGGIGAGYATAMTYWIITAIAVLVIWRGSIFSQYKGDYKVYPLSLKEWKVLLKIGVPIGLSIFFETSIFSAVTLFMSQYNTVTIAAHQAAINFESLLFMVPLSISMALTIAVAFENGASRHQDAKTYSQLGIGMALGIALILSVFLFLFRESFAHLYSEDTEVIAMTSHFLIYAVFFQISDALQAPIQGALRGYRDVNTALIMTLIAYWIIGLPAGYVLANFTHFGPFGYWIGLIIGLAIGAIGLAIRLNQIQNHNQKKDQTSS